MLSFSCQSDNCGQSEERPTQQVSEAKLFEFALDGLVRFVSEESAIVANQTRVDGCTISSQEVTAIA